MRRIAQVSLLSALMSLLPCLSLAQTNTYYGSWQTDLIGGRITDDPSSPFSYQALVQNRAYNASRPSNLVNAGGILFYNFTPIYRVSLGGQMLNSFYPRATGESQEFRAHETFEIDLREKSNYFFLFRLEERSLLGNTQWNWRYRQRAVVQISLPRKLSLVMYDEVFLNLNEPVWVNNNLFNQNRVFIGVQFPISKGNSLLVGYLNRYVLGRNNIRTVNHLLTVDLMFMNNFFYW